VFVLGAYPSALHVLWQPPRTSPYRRLAVNDEPVPLWTAPDDDTPLSDEAQFDRWRGLVAPGGELLPEWASFRRAGSANGTSGRPVQATLNRLGHDMQHACITDCLDYYCWRLGSSSKPQQGDMVATQYTPRAKAHGWPEAHIPLRPSTTALVREALQSRTRLERELDIASAPEVVTFGAEAFLVLRGVLEPEIAAPVPVKLSLSPELYGKPLSVVLRGRTVRWRSLIHPGNRDGLHNRLHDGWSPT
jgi:hypothetical protein